MAATIMSHRVGLAVLASAAIASLAGSLPAKAGNPVQCSAYAATAVQQQTQNASMGCGFTGVRWQPNWPAHYAWCMGATNWQINHEIQARQHDLQMCGGGSPGLMVKTFHNPRIGGMRLDWCRVWSAQCGAPAAHAYCHAKGYVQATNWQKAPNVGNWTNTRVIGTGQVCSGPQCDGFKSIQCSK